MKRVLVLHALRVASRLTHVNHVYCMPKYQRGNLYVYHHIDAPVTEELKTTKFDAIVLCYCFLSYVRSAISYERYQKKYDFLREKDARIIVIVQDDYTYNGILDEWLIKLNPHVIYSAVEENLDVLYPRAWAAGIPFRLGLTGYADSATVAKWDEFRKPWSERGIDIGTRVRKLPPYFGSQGVRKGRITEAFRDLAIEAGFKVDISTDPADVFAGDDWLRFMGDCKFTIGQKGGGSLADPYGEVKKAVDEYLAKYPDAPYDEIEAACFPGQDIPRGFQAISPRLFESATLEICQILSREEWPGGLTEYEDYIPLEDDLSNVEEVFEIMRDEARCEEMARSCKRKIVDSKAFDYSAFAEDVLSHAPDILPEIQPVDKALLEAHFERLSPFEALREFDGGLWLETFTRFLLPTIRGEQVPLLKTLVERRSADGGGTQALYAGEWPPQHRWIHTALAMLLDHLEARDPERLPHARRIMTELMEGKWPENDLYGWDMCECIYEPKDDTSRPSAVQAAASGEGQALHPMAQRVLLEIEGMFGGDRRGEWMFDYHLALHAANAVVMAVSTPAYSYYHRHDPERLAREVDAKFPPLDRTLGLCGHQVQAYCELMASLGYQCRDVQFFGEDLNAAAISHVCAEVYFGEKWRFFDVTWGWHAYRENPEDVLSIDEILDQTYNIAKNSFNVWSVNIDRNNPDYMYHLIDNHSGILVGGQGCIRIKNATQERINKIFPNIPNHIGYSQALYGAARDEGEYELVLEMPQEKPHRIAIDVKGMKKTKRMFGDDIFLDANGALLPVSSKIEFVTNEKVISLKCASNTHERPVVYMSGITVESLKEGHP